MAVTATDEPIKVTKGKARPDTISPSIQRRLWTCTNQSRIQHADFNRKRREFLDLYVGHHYKDYGVTPKQYLNLINVMVRSYLRSLVARNPKVMVTAKYPQFRSDAADYQLALNRLLVDIKFERALRRSVTNALFGVGVHMVGLTNQGTVKVEGKTYNMTEPFSDAVDQDDLVYDTTARVIEEIQFQGNKFFMPVDRLDAAGFKNFDRISTDAQRVHDPATGQDTAAGLSQDRDHEDRSFKQCATLLNMWLPFDGPNGIMVTLDNIQEERRPLKTVEWEGPYCGPYHWLGFEQVPNNVMPLPPVANLVALHRIINTIYNKNCDRAKNTKDIVTYLGNAADDASRVIGAPDMDSVRVSSQNSVSQVHMGGIDNVNMAFGIHLKELFSWAAGNLDSIAGLSAMSGTVGQDRMLLESASQTIADMQQSAMGWVKEIVESLAWYLISDPLISPPLTKQIEGTDIEIPVVFAPEGQAADWLSYNFNIQPYSMQLQTPQSKEAKITGILQNIVIPLLPEFEKQGLTLDLRNLLRLYGDLGDTPELYSLVQSLQAPVGPENPPVGQKPAKQPVTTRNYNRQSTATPQGQDRNLMAMLAGAPSANGKGGE